MPPPPGSAPFRRDVAEAAVESFIQADRGFGERASLRLGLRYEATNHSVDYLRLDPTVNVQYRLFDDTIVSAGSRVNFRDFGDYVQLIRNDGSRYQKRLTISAPSFPDPFAGGRVTIDETRTSLYRLDPAYRAPYTVGPAGQRHPAAARRPAAVGVLPHEFRDGTGAGQSRHDVHQGGPAAGGGERRVRFQARFYNVLNTSQIRGYSGVLSSPLFGRPTGYRRGRTVRLSMEVDF